MDGSICGSRSYEENEKGKYEPQFKFSSSFAYTKRKEIRFREREKRQGIQEKRKKGSEQSIEKKKKKMKTDRYLAQLLDLFCQIAIFDRQFGVLVDHFAQLMLLLI